MTRPLPQRSRGERVRRWWRGRRRRLGFVLMQSLATVAGSINWRLLAPVGTWLGGLHYAAALGTRSRLAADIAEALGCSQHDARAILRSAYRVNDRAVFEIIAVHSQRIAIAGPLSSCRVEGIERLRDLADVGRGALLLGMHMGNSMLMSGVLAASGLPVAVVYRESRKMPVGFLAELLERIGVQPIHVTHANPAAGSRQILRALRAGRFVYVLMDQGNKRTDVGVPVPFLGKQIMMPEGVTRLAQMAGVPVYPVLLRGVDAGWTFTVTEPIDVAVDVGAAVRMLAAVMEAQIRAYPQYWSWHHRRWRKQPAGGIPLTDDVL